MHHYMKNIDLDNPGLATALVCLIGEGVKGSHFSSHLSLFLENSSFSKRQAFEHLGFRVDINLYISIWSATLVESPILTELPLQSKGWHLNMARSFSKKEDIFFVVKLQPDVLNFQPETWGYGYMIQSLTCAFSHFSDGLKLNIHPSIHPDLCGFLVPGSL